MADSAVKIVESVDEAVEVKPPPGSWWKEYLPYVAAGVFAVGALALYNTFSSREVKKHIPKHVSALYVYPVKSCAGVKVSKWPVDYYGLRYDRNYMIVREKNGTMITQRELPVVSLIHPEITDEDGLIALRHRQHGTCKIVPPEEEKMIDVSVWGEPLKGIDLGDKVAAWLTKLIGIECRLVRMPKSHSRQPPYDARAPHLKGDPNVLHNVAYSDGFPFLLASAASGRWVDAGVRKEAAQTNTDLSNVKLPIRINRFRPNIVVDGSEVEPFEEDTWGSLAIQPRPLDNADSDSEDEDGEATAATSPLHLKFACLCTRCSMPNIEQESGTRSPHVNKLMSRYRETLLDGKPVRLFGVNYVHEKPGTISVGDFVKVLSHVSPPKLLPPK